MEQKKNLCAQIPLSLHEQVSEAREAAGQTTSEYVTNLLIEYFNLQKNGGNQIMANNSTRTMAFQIPETLFQRIKAHLERETQRTGRKLTQREFVLNLIEEALIEAEEDAAEEAERVNASMASASPTGTTTEEDDPEEDLPPEKP
nr:translation initiation factor 2 [uncultured Acetatifactor sp.]